jgi:hypothetical protein
MLVEAAWATVNHGVYRMRTCQNQNDEWGNSAGWYMSLETIAPLGEWSDRKAHSRGTLTASPNPPEITMT